MNQGRQTIDTNGYQEFFTFELKINSFYIQFD